MAKETEIAMAALAIIEEVFNEVHKDATPQVVRNYVWRIKRHLENHVTKLVFGE